MECRQLASRPRNNRENSCRVTWCRGGACPARKRLVTCNFFPGRNYRMVHSYIASLLDDFLLEVQCGKFLGRIDSHRLIYAASKNLREVSEKHKYLKGGLDVSSYAKTSSAGRVAQSEFRRMRVASKRMVIFVGALRNLACSRGDAGLFQASQMPSSLEEFNHLLGNATGYDGGRDPLANRVKCSINSDSFQFDFCRAELLLRHGPSRAA
jgi:hypothetical protein